MIFSFNSRLYKCRVEPGAVFLFRELDMALKTAASEFSILDSNSLPPFVHCGQDKGITRYEFFRVEHGNNETERPGKPPAFVDQRWIPEQYYFATVYRPHPSKSRFRFRTGADWIAIQTRGVPEPGIVYEPPSIVADSGEPLVLGAASPAVVLVELVVFLLPTKVYST
jgi:hypothetical protein